MYEAYFGLTGKPFQLNPDPRFFYRSVGHKRAVAYMRYGLQQEQGFIVVTGDVGTGKTMLVHNLFQEIDSQSVVAAKLVSSNVKDMDLLRLIAAEFDIPFEGASKASLLYQLEEFFKSCREEGKRVLLVIDEAQNLPRSSLEELRMLSNFEYRGAPLVQSFLLGQREFRTIMRAPGLEQLRQRVIAAYHLKPLSEPEIKAYVEHRLRKAGWDNDPSIDDGIYGRIFQATGGVPRRINTLFDRVLLNCYLDELHAVTFDVVDAVCDEVESEQSESGDDSSIAPEPLDRTEPEATTRSTAPQQPPQQPPPPAPNPAEPTARELAVLEELATLKQRLHATQRTIDQLKARLAERQVMQMTAPVVLNEDRVTRPPGPHERRGFPFWTTAFIVLLVLFAIGGIGFGAWILRG